MVMRGDAVRYAKPLFVATILTGSFLLFLVQPMIARMALPRLGGAPNVWNSAMLVYQALLLGGYAYAHRISALRPKTQTSMHVTCCVLAPGGIDNDTAATGRGGILMDLMAADSVNRAIIFRYLGTGPAHAAMVCDGRE